MNYFFLYQTLKAQLSPEAATHTSGEKAFGFLSEEFHSTYTTTDYNNYFSPFDIELSNQNPNSDFSYPVFHPKKDKQSDGCIILLHGLNERSWEKYLPWGYQLANYTGKTVILFPLAYHMNRSPLEWRDPRKMRDFVRQRHVVSPSVHELSVANVAISDRLTSHPERFLLSGYQAANDLLDLVDKIKKGHHPLIKTDAQVDFFAYSIGAFLAQVLILAHGNDKLNTSRLFCFSGGSAFNDLHGVSKYIMDSVAFERLKHYYNNEVNDTNNREVHYILNNTALGRSFIDMLSVKNIRKKAGSVYASMADRISAVVLKKDTVVIADSAKKALKGIDVDVWDFEYPYSHIMPFPLLNNKLVHKVNEAFDKLMIRSSLLFTT